MIIPESDTEWNKHPKFNNLMPQLQIDNYSFSLLSKKIDDGELIVMKVDYDTNKQGSAISLMEKVINIELWHSSILDLTP